MLKPLRTRLPALVGLALAALTLLPPGGWALCVAPGGHVVIEPVALDGGGCCESEWPGATTDVTSNDSDCDSCSDLTMFDGSAAPGRPPGLAAPALLPALAPARPATSPVDASAPWRDPAPPPASARRTGTLLRN